MDRVTRTVVSLFGFLTLGPNAGWLDKIVMELDMRLVGLLLVFLALGPIANWSDGINMNWVTMNVRSLLGFQSLEKLQIG